MDDRDWDFTLLAVLIAALAGISILQSKVLQAQQEAIVRHDEDITFLRLVARETEKRLADD